MVVDHCDCDYVMQYVQFTFIHPDLSEQADLQFLSGFQTHFIKSGGDHVHLHPTCQLPFVAHFPHYLHLQGAKAWATCALVQQAKWPMTGLPNHTFAFSRIFPRSLLPSQLKICLQKTPCPTVSGGVVSAVFSLAEIGDVWYKSGALMAPCRCSLLSVSRLSFLIKLCQPNLWSHF